MTPEPMLAGQRSQALPQPIYIQLPAPTTPVPYLLREIDIYAK